jgi:hypothetical protein
MTSRTDDAPTTVSVPDAGIAIAAWVVFGIYGLLDALFVVLAIIATDSVESATMVAYAVVAALPLAVMFVVLLFSMIRRNRVGPSICVVIGVISLVALVALITS